MANLNEHDVAVKMFRRLNEINITKIFDSVHVTVKIGKIFNVRYYNVRPH